MRKLARFTALFVAAALLATFILSACKKPATTYTVTFNANGGTLTGSSSVTVNAGDVITASTAPTADNDGYIFNCWNTQADGNGTDIVLPYVPSASITVYAKWTPAGPTQYSMVFDANGGSIVSGNATVNVNVGTPVNANQAPQVNKSGYNFGGWNSKTDGSGTPIIFPYTPYSNQTVYAVWTLKGETEFTIVFDANGGTLSGNASVTLNAGDAVNAGQVPEVGRAGYNFAGWNTHNDGSGEDISFPFTPSKNQTVYAVWHEQSAAQYTLTFNANGGTLSGVATTTVNAGDEVKASMVPFATRDGYFFAGWNTNANGSGNAVIFPYVVNSSHTIYAQWTEDTPTVTHYTLTFNANGGQLSGSATVTVQQDISVTAGQAPTATRGVFIFGGWNTKADGSGTAISFPYSVTSNHTVYAQWAPNAPVQYTLTFDANGGTLSGGATVKVNEGGSVSKAQAPTAEKDGYDFNQWNTKADGSGTAVSFPYPVVNDHTVYAQWTVAVVRYTVSFETHVNGLTVSSQLIEAGGKAAKPTVSRPYYAVEGWYKDGGYTQKFDFDTMTITGDMTLHAKWYESAPIDIQSYGGYNESVYATWVDANPQNAEAFYKAHNSNTWVPVDQELVRESEGLARVDVVGLKAGEYDLKIMTSSGTELIVRQIITRAYDRSGYAHFKLSSEAVVADGIGAYKNDGTLKENAVVVYVTEQNKNDVMIINPKTDNPVHTYQGRTGIGWLLNNRQYSFNNEGKGGNSSYDSNGAKLSISNLDVPLCIRIIGKVTAPEGLTAYNSVEFGGSKGDNGFMARIKDCNNITIEGIGEDAEIYGWGIHFMANSTGRGIGFEVRNVTFDQYPEDALGMEGTTDHSVLVQRCWIHNVTFKSGYCKNPTESDKAYGDGSCDFKRGQYYTVSYCHFVDGHKTNLIGASDSNQQFHMTFHHNRWTNCVSRIPLARQANIHMYNNYIEVEPSATNDRAQDVRANSLIFSEANYFSNCKDPSDVGGGAIKSYGDVKYSCYGRDGATVVMDRAASVSSGNKYANFDTNPDVFYYKNGVSDVEHLTDAVTAKIECIMYSGANKSGHEEQAVRDDAKIWTASPVTIDQSVTVTNTIKLNKSASYLLFKIQTDATFTMTSTSTVPAALVDIYGVPQLIGSGSVDLKPGIYSLESSNVKSNKNAKEAAISGYSIILDQGAAKQARIKNAVDAFDALPTANEVQYTAAHYALINAAKAAYSELKSAEEIADAGVDISTVNTIEGMYVAKGIIFVETKINAIGTVDANSFGKIHEARNAYTDALPAIQSGISNYAVLTAAEKAFQGFAVQSFKDLVSVLPATSGISGRTAIESALSQYQTALNAYESLGDEQQAQVATQHKKVTDGISALTAAFLPYEIMDMIDGFPANDDINLSTGKIIAMAKEAFESLNATQLAIITQPYKDKLNTAYGIYHALASQTIIHSFDNGTTSDYFNITGSISSPGKGGPVTVGNITVTKSLKMESKASITFTTGEIPMTLSLYFSGNSISGGEILVNTEKYSSFVNVDGAYKLTVELEANTTYTIKRSKNELALFYIELSPENS